MSSEGPVSPTSPASPVGTQVLVFAKAPVPGRVKTRLCPPFTPAQAAALARAALADTVATVDGVDTDRRVLVLDGAYPAPAGWEVVAQRGNGLADRIWHAFADTARPGCATVLIGMDTPHAHPDLLAGAAAELAAADAVLGPAADGGWWLLGLREPRHAVALRAVPMSVPETGARTAAALRARGLRLATTAPLRDVDTAADAWAVAAAHPHLRFSAELRAHHRQAGQVNARAVAGS